MTLFGAAGGDVLALWQQFRQGWEAGGLAFVLFIVVILLFTGRVVSGRDRDRVIKEWEQRYRENDERWKERFLEQKARADTAQQMLYQHLGWASRVTTVAERATAVAEAAAQPNTSPGAPGLKG